MMRPPVHLLVDTTYYSRWTILVDKIEKRRKLLCGVWLQSRILSTWLWTSTSWWTTFSRASSAFIRG